jgi:D-isomer specific 2-hydroxyacid dehydrogenase, NAD binding domain
MRESVTTPVPKALYLLDGEAFQKIYGEEERAAVAGLADVYAPLQTADSVAKNPDVLAGVAVILSGRGAPAMDTAFLEAAPNLRVVLYGAGGAIVREAEMVEVLEERPDLWAVLDVTHPEPPEPDSRLYGLPNVVLTPHIAGSLGRECRRMGRLVVDELRRYVAGEPLKYEITRERAALMA